MATIYWRVIDRKVIDLIRKKFSIPEGITVNGETPLPFDFNINDPLLRETERRGFITIRNK